MTGAFVDGWYVNGFEKIKMKKIIIKLPVAKGYLANAAGGWNAEKLSDDELVSALKAVNAAHYMLRFSRRFAVSSGVAQAVTQAANQELHDKVMGECQKRDFWKKYTVEVTVKKPF